MAAYDRTDSPGGIVGVVVDGDVVFVKGYGMANLTHGLPITPATRFNLGSVAKQFTAFAIGLLESRGALSIDDPVTRHIPELPAFDQEVTLRHLLTHTSGYRETYGIGGLAGYGPDDAVFPRDDAIRVVQRQSELEFAPGSNWQYNSSAYVILAIVVERVTGESFPQWMRANVFEPLGMYDTLVEEEIEQVIPGAADSYSDLAGGGYRTAFSNRAYHGAADVYTTVTDLAKWLDNFDTGALGGLAVQQRMRERFVLTSGDTTNYALGINVDELNGLARIHHTGSHAGYRAALSWFPEIDAGVIFMSNYAALGPGMANRVARVFFAEHMTQAVAATQAGPAAEGAAAPHTLSAALLDRYAGEYQIEGGPPFTVARAAEGLTGSVQGQTFPLIALSDTLFAVGDVRSADRLMFYTAPEAGAPSATIWFSDRVFPLHRVIAGPVSGELRAYTGRYFSEEVGTIYTLELRNDTLFATHRINGDVQLRAVGDDAFTGIEIPLHFEFKRDAEGAITGFSISIVRTTRVWFERM